MRHRLLHISVGLVFGAAMSHPALAATLCVGSGSGCHHTIGSAVAAAAPGDTIQVNGGTYHETVVVDKALSLIGSQHHTVIDALGLPYGINIDGFDHPGLAHVAVTGFTIKNANFEGIFITNASDVTVRENEVLHNNRNLNAGQCPGLLPPDSEAGEAFDCGEGIHLSGVDHSTIASNLVEHNAGGILLSDDSGPTHDNLISGNVVRENEEDCGITLASHKPVAPNGVFHNTIAGNESSRNGLATGGGAGIGMFTPAPGTATYGNVVVGNRVTDNALPGVALHSHAPGQTLTDNAIIGNYIAGNGADTDDTATPGPTGINIASGRTPGGVVVGSPITGTIVSQNVIERESVAIAISNPAGAVVNLHLNDLGSRHVGVDNLGAGSVNAIENWWGCSRGPGAGGCSTIAGADVTFTPWLRQPVHDDHDHGHK